MSTFTLNTIFGTPRRGFAALVAMWTRRARTRQALKHLDAHMLRDIGLTDFEVRREVERPFWD